MIHHLNRSGRMGMFVGERRVVQPDEQRGRDPRQDRGCRSGRRHHRNAGQAFLQHRHTCEPVDHHQEQEAVRQDVVHRRARYGNMVSRRLREFTDEDIAKVSTAFDAFRDGTLETEKGFSAIATTEDIKAQDTS